MTPHTAELIEARRLIGEGRHAPAMDALGALVAADPTDLDALRLLAHTAGACLKWTVAESMSRRAIEIDGGSAADLALMATALQRQHKSVEAIEVFGKLLAMARDLPSIECARLGRAYCFGVLNRWQEAEEELRALIAVDPRAEFYTRLAEDLYQRGRADDARSAAQQAIALDPAQTRARAVLGLLTYGDARPPRQHAVSIWPAKATAFRDARAVVQASVLGGYPDGEPFITPSTRFITLGSCFAENLAAHLRLNGFHAHSEVIGEQVNNTYANRYFMEWIEQGVVSEATRQMADAYGEDMKRRYQAALCECDVFVFTLGVAPCFFDAETGDFVFVNTAYVSYKGLMSRAVMRQTSIHENVENIRSILASVRRLSGNNPHIVLTVSPVPLAGASNAQSAVIADCLSKSTLRLACDEVLTAESSARTHYWPSFEIVRWLAPFFDRSYPPVFGAEDGKTRHVSTWIVELAIELFIQTYAVRFQDN